MSNNIDKDMVSVPYFVHEGAMARWERNFRFILIMLIIVVFLLFATNTIWIVYWYQFDTVTEEITMEADGEGNVGYIGHNGDISYGEDKNQTT